MKKYKVEKDKVLQAIVVLQEGQDPEVELSGYINNGCTYAEIMVETINNEE